MKKRKTAATDATELRERAEERLAARTRGAERGDGRISEADAHRLVHELEVHQVELEMQNEELRAARNEAESGLERYTAIFDFAPICYATLGPDETIREINHAGAYLLGRDRSRLLGRHFGTFVAERHRVAFSTLVRRALDSDEKETCELEVVKSGYASIQVRLWVSLLARTERTILLACEDITESKRKEEKILRAEAALRETDRRKDEFLAVLSHELRNPLAPIRNGLYILARAEPGGQQAHQAQAIIQRQVTSSRASSMICSMSPVSRAGRSSSGASMWISGISCDGPWKTIARASKRAASSSRVGSSRASSGSTPILLGSARPSATCSATRRSSHREAETSPSAWSAAAAAASCGCATPVPASRRKSFSICSSRSARRPRPWIALVAVSAWGSR